MGCGAGASDPSGPDRGGKGTECNEVAGALGGAPWWGGGWTVPVKTKFGAYLRFHSNGISVPQPVSFSHTHTHSVLPTEGAELRQDECSPGPAVA